MMRWLEKKRNFSWMITLIIAVFIFYISSLPSAKIGTGGIAILPTIYHILIFFLLALFLFISLINGKKTGFLLFAAISFLLSYAILDELHQLFVPGRCCSLSDFGLDSLGILFAFMIYTISLIYRRKFS